MKNEFVPYEEALAMEELGWGKENTMYYAYSRATKNFYPHRFEFPKDKGKLIKAPLYQQAFRWFRERGYVTFDRPKLDSIGVEPARLKFAIDIAECKYGGMTKMELMNTYEEAQDACLRKLIEIVKEKEYENN